MAENRTSHGLCTNQNKRPGTLPGQLAAEDSLSRAAIHL